MRQLLCLALCFFLIFKTVFGQQNIIQHTIKKGETVFKIAKDYGVSIQSIYNLNPGSEKVIYAGGTLKIPKSVSSSSVNSSDIITYKVVRGDTKIGLSRKFGVSLASLEQQNPIIINMLQANHVLKIDKGFIPEKIKVINGERYVDKGETLWGIAKENGISVDVLVAANKDRLDDVLKAGQTLRIPDKDSSFTTSGFYIVQKGDTKWGLSQRFDTTIVSLEENNPQIKDLLMAGQRIRIYQNNDSDENIVSTAEVDDVANNNTETESKSKPENQNLGFREYVIKPNETLFGLSRTAGMSMVDFKKLNPKLENGVIEGSVIKMPNSAPIQSNLVENNKSNPSIYSNKRNSNLLENLDFDKGIELYFYLPFSQKDFEERNTKSDVIASSEVYSNERLEFYEGASMAMDSIKNIGLKFDVALINSDTSDVINIDRSGPNNAVVIPFLEGKEYPKIVSEKPTTVISVSTNVLSNKNNGNKVYEAVPSLNKQKLKILNYIHSLNANVIVVSDLEKMRNEDIVLSILPNAKFLKVDKTGLFEENALKDILDKNKVNYIILDTDKTIVFLNTTTSFMSELSSYDIQIALLEESQIPKKGKVSEIRFKILKLIYPSALPANKHDKLSSFEENYESKFNKTPTNNAIMGFDVTFDLLLRLGQSSSFEETIQKIKSQHLGLKFDFQKTTDNSYQNKGAYILQFSSSNDIIEID